jgi:hypothetical protein
MSASERNADITGYIALFGFMSTRLDRVDIRALQNRFRIAIARHLDHGAAELFAGRHVVRRGSHHPGQQRRGDSVDCVDPGGLRPDAVQRLDAGRPEHVRRLERQLQEIVLGLALDPRPSQRALLG